MIFLSSESVSEGHPDKICDQISDSVLDFCLSIDQKAHVACEVFCCRKVIVVGGEISFSSKELEKKVNLTDDIVQIVKNVLEKIYLKNQEIDYGINFSEIKIINLISKQSKEIKKSVDSSIDDKNSLGAGDQGMCYGYAVNKPDANYLPEPYFLAQKLIWMATQFRKNFYPDKIFPDMKCQISGDFDVQKKFITKVIVLSCQHAKNFPLLDLRTLLNKEVIQKFIQKYQYLSSFSDKLEIKINSAGNFHYGGFVADTGLTGRKLAVDTYGSWGKIGGGALSGKDLTKVDRSGAYFARYIAKNLICLGIADECEVQLAFSIGISKPVAYYLNFTNLNFEKFKQYNIYQKNLTAEELTKIVFSVFDCRVSSIINLLSSEKISYNKTATYGHFTAPDYPWEKADMVDILKNKIIGWYAERNN
ncbi:methionine adenosyltransferase [symbiont of Argiope bruennichi]|uniref:methionine adenosyltransferase n=1 Tax=symbiont of Argiope bruennichi TaxID=2810479 RepID=UPI003DA323D3